MVENDDVAVENKGDADKNDSQEDGYIFNHQDDTSEDDGLI